MNEPDEMIIDAGKVNWFEFQMRLWNQVSYIALTQYLEYVGWKKYQVVTYKTKES